MTEKKSTLTKHLAHACVQQAGNPICAMTAVCIKENDADAVEHMMCGLVELVCAMAEACYDHGLNSDIIDTVAETSAELRSRMEAMSDNDEGEDEDEDD